MPTQGDVRLGWRGFHHVALVTRDLESTIRFYGEVLGMETGEVLGTTAAGPGARHCFIQPGGAGLGFHFFEHPEAQLFSLFGGSEVRFRFLDGALQHIALALPDEAAGRALQSRLQARGISTIGIGDLGRQRTLMFPDNNGTLIEATWPRSEEAAPAGG